MAAAVMLAAGWCAQARADPAPSVPSVDADGEIHAAAVDIPVSSFLSPEAKAQLIARLHAAPAPSVVKDGIEAAREGSRQIEKPILAKWLEIYPATIEPTMIGGVQTDVITPKAGIAPRNRDRILINLHGGGFLTGARFGGQAESVPLAGRGRIKVVAVDYRMAPEYVFPAASEDVEKVYRALLKHYKPSHIGIFGCSAGGTLTAQAVAWFQTQDLPRPGAIGVFCSGAMPTFWFGGDSGELAGLLNATAPMRPATSFPPGTTRFYFDGADPNAALVSPALHPDVLAKFPPTLIVTGTRDTAMSNALVTNVRLLEAGAETQLLVLEGIGHGQFNAFAGTPEAASTYDIIWRFFDTHLGR